MLSALCAVMHYVARMARENHKQSEWLDLTQAETEYPVSRRSLWHFIAQERLPAYRPFRKVLIKRADLESLIESTRIGADLDKIADEAVREVLR